MTVEQMCRLGKVSRASFYRFDPAASKLDKDLDLRDAIQRVALEFPSYGRPPDHGRVEATGLDRSRSSTGGTHHGRG
jgi:hypothetical protein